MIGNNACGAHALAYGKTADNVEALSLLLADGRSADAPARWPSWPTRSAPS